MYRLLLLIQSIIPTTAGDENLIAEEVEKTNSFFAGLKGVSIDQAIDKIANTLVHFSFKLAIALLVLYVGKLIIRKIYKVLSGMLLRRRVDPSLTTFILSLVKITLYFFLIITIIGILGIETTSFLALFASAGVAIGMALSGTLQNFAGGVLILLLKTYKVGDYIEAQGYSGTVKEIQIFHTIINTIDNKAIILPNGILSTSSINNYSLEDYRRVDWTIGLSYGTDFAKAKAHILNMLDSDERVVKEFVEDDRLDRQARGLEIAEEEHEIQMQEQLRVAPWYKRIFHSRKKIAEKLNKDLPKVVFKKVSRKPFVGLNELADSSINLTVRAWTHSSNYWDLYFEMNERFYTELPEAGFSFPFPQLDVHLNPEN